MEMIKPKIVKPRNNEIKGSSGFTLIETLTTVFLFTIVALVISSILVRAMQIERRAFAAQVIQENALAVFEVMAKEIRVSRISNQNNDCSVAPNTSLTSEHPINGNTVYQLGSEGIVEQIIGGVKYHLSSGDVLFNSLGFCVLGSGLPSDNQSSRVTIIASISNKSGVEFLTVKFQTTVTSRDASDEFEN